jgi:Xaa-Pro aminopeptidase
VLSLDSGADLAGYVADVARMAIACEPSARHADLLAQVEMVQQTARDTVAAGRRGREIPEAAHACIATLPDAERMAFHAHGMGLLTHEAPRLVANGSPSHPPTHRDRPLEADMVISIETHVADPEIGFVKLEDTVIVTADGCEDIAAHGRDWNIFGEARPNGLCEGGPRGLVSASCSRRRGDVRSERGGVAEPDTWPNRSATARVVALANRATAV